MKTYYEIAPQIPIDHKIWVDDVRISLAEHMTVAQLCERTWQHNEYHSLSKIFD